MHFETEERGKRRTYHIRKSVTTLGRDMGCDISMASVSVSRRHVSFTQDGSTLLFKDLGSRNGLKLNGVQTREGVLADGDRLSIGELVLLFRSGTGEPAAASPPPPSEPEPARPPTGDENAPTPLDLSFSAAPPAAPPSPVPAPDPADPAGIPSTAMPPPVIPFWKNRRILAVGAACILLIAGLAVAKVLLPKPAVHIEVYTHDRYLADLMKAVDAFRESEDLRKAGVPHQPRLSEARRILQEADRRFPPPQGEGWANLLDRALAFHERLGKDYRNYPDDDAHDAWEALKKQRGLPEDIQILATARLKWMESENGALKALDDGKLAAEAGKRDEAIAILLKVAPGTLAHPEALAMAARFRKEALEALLAQSDERCRDAAWDQATAALEKGKNYASSPEENDAIQNRLQKIQSERREEQDLAQAQKAFALGEKGYAEAKSLLARIPQESNRHAQATDILQRIAERENLAQLRALFADGKGPELLQAIASSAITGGEVSKLKDLATQAVAASTQMQTLTTAGRIQEARGAAQRLKDLLAAPQHEHNPYRMTAEAFLAEWTPSRIADQHLKKGLDCIDRSQDEIEARKEFDLALAADPTMLAVGEAIKKRIYPKVRKLRTDAYDLEREGQLEQAKSILQRVKDMLRASDAEYWTRANKDLEELAEKMKAP